MRCNRVLDRLDDHVDGLLPAREAEAIRDHLDVCTECRETALAVKASSNSLAGWNDAEPSAECFDKILARLEALPLEAFERAAAANAARHAPSGFDSARIVRLRRVATGGLAAAATVLGALVVSRNETRAPRHAQPFAQTPAVYQPAAASSFFQGYDFDDGLHRQNPAPARSAAAGFDLEAPPR
jgi:anti-sigma factor RsiW